MSEQSDNEKKCVHCQDFPYCRKEKEEPFYGVLNCGCSACECLNSVNDKIAQDLVKNCTHCYPKAIIQSF